jgi:MFS family permease
LSRSSVEAILNADQLEAARRPRSGLVAERAIGPGRFEQEAGPFRAYRRVVVAEPLDDAERAFRVHQTVDFSLSLPYFSWLFILPLRWALRGLKSEDRPPWWAPPQRMDRRAAVVLATLAALAVVVGYLGALLTLTMTYAAGEFGVGKTGQGVALGAVRVNVVLALGILVLADRRGRRRLILLTATGASLLTVVGALSPSLVWLTASQVAAVSLVAALLVLIGVMTAEEVPAGSRAWSIGVVGMATGLGAGLATMALPLADLGAGGWRWLYVGGIFALPLILSTARHLPESRRFTAPANRRPSPAQDERSRKRLLLLCTGGFLVALFATPSGQFHNEFLRTERAFSAARISALSLVSGTIGGLGVLVGGRLADVRGRRLVAAVGVGVGIGTTLASYLGHGWSLWIWGVADSFLGYAVAPALGVYGPELFPTATRSRAAGVVAASYAAGGVVGLVATGLLSSTFSTLAPAFAILAVGPAVLVVLIVFAYPETAGVELEDLNPSDLSPGEPASAIDGRTQDGTVVAPPMPPAGAPPPVAGR